MRTLLVCCVLLLAAAGAHADVPPAGEVVGGLESGITAADLRAEVGYLADDALEGRLTGTEGAAQAAEFIAEVFRRAGLVPAPGMDDYFQPFTFQSGVTMGEDNSLAVDGEPLSLEEDFVPLTFSGSGSASGEVVFIGFGLVEPKDNGYNSYANVDVTDKVVLCLRDIPEAVTSERRQELALYAGDRYKAKQAADRGAAAFLLVTGPNSPGAGELIRFRETDRSSTIPIPAMSVTDATADRILAGADTDLQTRQDALDEGVINPHADTRAGHAVEVSVELEAVTGECRNVVAMLPPSDGVEEYVLLGAHYDHIGYGEGLGSMATDDEEGMVHNGADDNASGTSVVLELAAALAERGPEPRRGVLFAAWSGEELGLVGSAHFGENPPVPMESIAATFNFDMVGRLRENRLVVQAVGSSSAWRGLLERRNIPAGFDLSLQDDPYLPTDLTSFYTRDVPGLSFFTDLHDDYNRPSDDAGTLDYEGMERVGRFAERLTLDVIDPSLDIDYVRVEQSAPSTGRMRRRIFTGVVPDFGSSGDSAMRLSDVRPGSPAQEAGLVGGDVIVEFAGKSIGSLQDYADALAGAKADETVSMVILRDGERMEMSITPRVRDR